MSGIRMACSNGFDVVTRYDLAEAGGTGGIVVEDEMGRRLSGVGQEGGQVSGRLTHPNPRPAQGPKVNPADDLERTR